ncbi:MAG: response regulator [Elusimicrobia bacterium]|nr:response regulator [Candidatus Liberimonas magnetica]
MSGERILVVDSNNLVREVCSRFLKTKYEVYLAETGDEARKMFLEINFDVMLVDLNIRGINALDLLKRIKKDYSKCAVVIMTGQWVPQMLADIMKEGGFGYLEKPFELAELDYIIKSALEKRSKYKEYLEGKKIMVVDDEDELLDFFRTVFELEKANVITLHDGKSVLSKIEQESPDIILLDLMLSGISGFEICRNIKSNDKFKKIPVFILTSRADEKDRIKGIEAGADNYFMKSINPQALIQEVAKYLAGR